MNDTPPSLAQVLKTLFPAQRTQHIHWSTHDKVEREKIKKVYTRHLPARPFDFAQHLAEETSAGPGALGLMPGFLVGPRQVPLTTWAMLDFDEQTPDDLTPLFTVLQRQGLSVLFNGGTTGRGAHLWFLLSRPIPLHQAQASLRFLTRVARELGAGEVEMRPVATARQVGVFLPYRGAALDTYGVNPLVDYATAEILSLPELAGRPRQAAPDFVRLGRLWSVQRFIAGKVRPRPQWRPRLESVIPQGKNPDLWEDELERLEGLWEEGRRHFLTIAATCHGLNCGVSGEKIERDLLDLARRCGDEEVPERQRAISSALVRPARGEATSASYFYELAEVPPPSKVSAEARETVGQLLDDMMRALWKGTAGRSARSVYKALLRLAWHHGHDHTEGVEVSVAWTQLEREANVGSPATLRNSLVLLEERELLRRGLASQAGKSGSFVLLTTERSTHITGEGVRGYFNSSLHLRNGVGRLGKTAEYLFDLLLYHGPVRFEELARRMDARPFDLRRHRDALLATGAIQEDEEGTLSVVPDAREHFGRRFRDDGSLAAEERQERRIEVRRARYRAR